MSNRFEELDSLRGLASSTVVIHHCLLTFFVFLAANNHEEFGSGFIMNLFTNTPLHVFWAGHEAVILFFVLSGFVLSFPFSRSNQVYSVYLIKRICRIYLPYLFSIVLSVSLFNIINPATQGGLSSWFNGMWEHQISIKEIFSYVFMLGLDVHNFNTVTWSLIHEMRISIFFPFMMLVINKYHWKKTLPVGLILFLGMWITFEVISIFLNHMESASFIAKSFGKTFYYSSFFLIGALVARHKDYFSRLFLKCNRIVKWLLLTSALFLYTFEWWSPAVGSLKNNGNIAERAASLIAIDYAVAISVVILFIAVLNSKKLKEPLHNRFLLLLGKVSYSLYLIHPIVLLTMIHTLRGVLPLQAIVLMVPAFSFFLAVAMYKFIEEPSMRLGKQLTKNGRMSGAIIKSKIKIDAKSETVK